MSARVILSLGAVLMLLLGLARGLGGLLLLIQGSATDPNISATANAVSIVGTILLLLGTALVVAAIGVWRRIRRFWLFGIVCTILFVVDGAINGYMLYGRPGQGGTLVNVTVAVLILVCLHLGRSALRPTAASSGGVTEDR